MAGVGLHTVQKLLGHKTITMTVRYAHLAPAHLKKAVDTLSTKTSQYFGWKMIIYRKMICNCLKLLVPKGGLEPPCPQGTPDFESNASLNPYHPQSVAMTGKTNSIKALRGIGVFGLSSIVEYRSASWQS